MVSKIRREGPLKKKDSHPKPSCGSDCAHASGHVDSCARSYVITRT